MNNSSCLPIFSLSAKKFIQSFLSPVKDEAINFIRLSHGRNNRAWLLVGGKEKYFLKEYFRHLGDTRDRLASEFAFSGFCIQSGIDCVPKPLACEHDAGMAIYEWLEGVAPNEAEADLVRDAMEFASRLAEHSCKPQARGLPLASDACRSPSDHLRLAERRLDALLECLPGRGGIYDEALRFAQTKLAPALSTASKDILHNISGAELAAPLGPGEMIASPSDFGFHNALVTRTGTRFVDFEYAGMDDPVKMVCDFFCQPEIPVDERYMEDFCDSLTGYDSQKIFWRSRLFMPAHRIKWCLIMLNEFKRVDAERRYFAGGHGLLETQLQKARFYFQQHLSMPPG